ncbi:MAG: T9SS type A sorting domain-containing protein [Ignavibacteria bacterium]|nr:T9SS type A sorting domain-containing protein [Ignavibacteria bacterium]
MSDSLFIISNDPINIVLGINTVNAAIPFDFSLSQNYPNPFNPQSKIRFQISKFSDTRLIVYDMLGKEIETLVNQELREGTYEVDFDGSKYSSGVYFYKLITRDFAETRKMILLK